MRPPSSGYAGIRFTNPSTRFRKTRTESTPVALLNASPSANAQAVSASRTSPIAMLTSGPDAAMAASSPGFVGAGIERGRAAEERHDDGPNVDAAASSHDRVGEVVRHRAHEEAERDDPAEDPRRHRLDRGVDRRQLADRDDRDEREDDDPAELDPDLDAERRARSGCRSWSSPRGGQDRAGARARRVPARPPHGEQRHDERDDARRPSIVSYQKRSGKSWTRRSVVGSKV